MAKGDSDRAQNQINYQGGLAQNNLNNLRDAMVPQSQEAYNNYQRSLGAASGQFNDIMGQYNNFLGRQPQGNNFNPEYSGYQDFSQTGGFSPQNIQDIRARSIAPTRAAYSQGMEQVRRSQALTGASNAPAAISRMTRQQGQAVSDANVNANAGIAQMVQQGKLAGLGGMTGIDQARLQGELANSGMNLGAMQGMNQLYGTTPGMAGLAGSMLNAQNNNLMGTQGMQNQLSLGMMGNQINKGAIPGNFQQGLQNATGIMGLIGRGASMFAPFGGGGIGGGGDYSGLSPDQMSYWGSGFTGPTQPGMESVGSTGRYPGMFNFGSMPLQYLS